MWHGLRNDIIMWNVVYAAPILQQDWVGHWRNNVLEGHAPFHFNFFLQKMFARLTLQFPSTYICICNRVRSVSFSDGEFRDRDIIFRDETDLVFCFLSCLVKFPALEANSWQRRASLNPGNWVCLSLAFFHDQTHTLTQTRKVRRHAERPKGDREQFASLDFWIKCFTRGVHLVSNMIWFVHRIN